LRTKDQEQRAVVFVSAGTDKRFPYPRLIEWTASWATSHDDKVDVLVQAGITPCPDLPSAAEYPPQEMRRLLRGSHAAVMQGGPGGVMTARSCGLLPILVPRRHKFGEAVDDHQVDFGRWAQDRGLTLTVETEPALHTALDALLDERTRYAIDPPPSPTLGTVQRIEAEIDRHLAAGVGRSRRLRTGRRRQAVVAGSTRGRGQPLFAPSPGEPLGPRSLRF